MRRFDYRDGTTATFWAVDLQGMTHATPLGKVGSSGQTQMKAYPTEAKARKAFDRLLADMLGTCDAKVTAGSPSPTPKNVTPPAPQTKRSATPPSPIPAKVKPTRLNKQPKPTAQSGAKLRVRKSPDLKREGFLQASLGDADNDDPRLRFADRLDRRGDPLDENHLTDANPEALAGPARLSRDHPLRLDRGVFARRLPHVLQFPLYYQPVISQKYPGSLSAVRNSPGNCPGRS